MNQFLAASLLIFTFHFAHAWGEKGHHASGYVAAVIAHEHLSADEQKLFGTAFRERTHQMGHLNNIPDISWKDSRRKTVVKYNGPTHYFDPEVLLGEPLDQQKKVTPNHSNEYLEKIKNLEKNFDQLKAQFEGATNTLPGAPQDRKKINVYFHVGTSPWRVQDLFDNLVHAFQCAAKKPKLKKKDYKKDFVTALKEANEKPRIPYYSCTDKTTRLEDIQAAFTFAGVMGHFVSDMSQPYHTTMDFDGWLTGQGGIHAYFETFLVHFLKEDFLGEITEKAKKDREKLWQKVAPKNNEDPYYAVQVLLNLTADSLTELKTLREIDRKNALIKESARLPYGSNPGRPEAERKPYTDEKVAKAFRSFASDRLALSSVVLSRLWVEAWRRAGRPEISDVDLITVPYILDVPFLWPAYSKGY